jgi:hypothetical protein
MDELQNRLVDMFNIKYLAAYLCPGMQVTLMANIEIKSFTADHLN